MEDKAQSLPQSLRERMSRPEERSTFESWWYKSSLADMVPGHLAEPVHDLAVVPMIEKGYETSLVAAIKEYLSSETTHSSFLDSIDLNDCSWEKIFDALRHAKNVYEQKAEGNPVRRCFRRGNGFQRNLRPWVEGIPGENGVGLIKGGMQLVLNAIQRRSATCEKIFEQFESVPRCVCHAEHLQALHPTSSRLNATLRDLYLSLLRCLPKLIRILLREEPSRLKKFGNSLFKDSELQVEETLKPLKEAVSRLEECQGELLSSGVVQSYDLLRLVDRKHDATRAQLELATMKLTEVQDFQASLPQVLEQKLEAFKSALRYEFGQQLKNHMYLFLQEQMRMSMCTRGDQAAQLSRLLEYQASTRKDARSELLESLCSEEEQRAPSTDRASVFQMYHNFKAKALARSNQLLSHPRFGEWVGVLHSDILLVNGHCEGEMIGTMSALSIFCASLIDSLSPAAYRDPLPQSPFIVVEYFAGQHETNSSGLEGPHGMMRSLIHQVLVQWPDGVPLTWPARRNESFSEAHTWSVTSLCQLFEYIIGQLPREFPVWCVIDNISNFEASYGGWDMKLDEIVDYFDRYVENDKRTGASSAPVKFLLTAARSSINIYERIPADSQVNLRDGGVLSHHVGPESFRSLMADD